MALIPREVISLAFKKDLFTDISLIPSSVAQPSKLHRFDVNSQAQFAPLELGNGRQTRVVGVKTLPIFHQIFIHRSGFADREGELKNTPLLKDLYSKV